MRKVVLSVPGISCEHRERVVSGALTPLQGIRSVNVNIRASQVEVEYDEATGRRRADETGTGRRGLSVQAVLEP